MSTRVAERPDAEHRAPVLRATGLSKAYRAETMLTQALDGVELTLDAGEFVSIMGQSGSGKSTLLSVLSLMEPVDTGEIWLDGQPCQGLDTRARSRLRLHTIGMVFQYFHLLSDLSVYDNIALPMRYAGKEEPVIAERVSSLARRLGMEHRLHHRPVQLSGGQQQRVAIARALANAPRLLLVDEPTGNLDSQNSMQVMALLGDLHAEGHTICLVTHHPACAELAQRRLRMRDGRLSADPG